MANGTIKINPLLSKKKWADTVEFTPTSGTSYLNGCRYIKLTDCLVWIAISVSFNSAPSNEIMFTLPEGLRPLDNTPILVDGGETLNAKAQCVIKTSGEIRVTSVDKYVIGNGFFLI